MKLSSEDQEQIALKESLVAMERVLAIVAHELRTPLAGMRAMVEMLQCPESRGSGNDAEFLRRLHQEILRMSQTIDDLLEAARLNSGKARWNWSDFGLEPVCRLAIESVRPLLDQQVELRSEVDPPALRMNGDADALRRLLINLLSNARKHTEGGQIRVTVRGRRANGLPWIELSVTDTGRGMEPQVLAKLGEAFALNSGVVGANSFSGTGLGLAICKGIAEAHGGTMRADSKLGHGTTILALLRADLAAPTAGQPPMSIVPPTGPAKSAA